MYRCCSTWRTRLGRCGGGVRRRLASRRYLGPDREHEPFRIAFARGLRGGIFTAWMPGPARTASDDARNCPARSRTRNRKPRGAITGIHQEITDLLGGPRSVRMRGDPGNVTWRLLASMTWKQEGRRRMKARCMWEKRVVGIAAPSVNTSTTTTRTDCSGPSTAGMRALLSPGASRARCAAASA
jgi:hypothetical protein